MVAKQKVMPKYIILPDSTGRQLWDLLVIILVLYNAFVLPVTVGFDLEYDVLIKFDIFVDAVFYLDIVLNFFTTYDVAGLYINNYRQVAWHYFKKWFWLDLVASFPFDHFGALFSSSSNESLGLLRGLKTIRLLRLARLLKFLDKFQVFSHLLRMFRLFFFFFLVSHWFACVWYLIGSFHDGGWLSSSDIDPENESLVSVYLSCMYWVLVTFLTVGYGDINVVTSWEKLFAVLTMLVGAILYAVIFGNVNILLESLGRSDRVYTEKMEAVNYYMQDLELPMHLQHRVRGYYQYLWARHKSFEESNTLRELPQELLSEIAGLLHDEFFHRCPIFSKASELMRRNIASKFKFAVSLPNEFVIREGETAQKVFFVRKGELEVSNLAHGELTIMTDFSYFGEIALLLHEETDRKRTASVKSLVNCDLYTLEGEELFALLDSYPQYDQLFTLLARERLRQVKMHDDESMVAGFFRKVGLKVLSGKEGKTEEGGKKDSNVHSTKLVLLSEMHGIGGQQEEEEDEDEESTDDSDDSDTDTDDSDSDSDDGTDDSDDGTDDSDEKDGSDQSDEKDGSDQSEDSDEKGDDNDSGSADASNTDKSDNSGQSDDNSSGAKSDDNDGSDNSDGTGNSDGTDNSDDGDGTGDSDDTDNTSDGTEGSKSKATEAIEMSDMKKKETASTDAGDSDDSDDDSDGTDDSESGDDSPW